MKKQAKPTQQEKSIDSSSLKRKVESSSESSLSSSSSDEESTKKPKSDKKEEKEENAEKTAVTAEPSKTDQIVETKDGNMIILGGGESMWKKNTEKSSSHFDESKMREDEFENYLEDLLL